MSAVGSATVIVTANETGTGTGREIEIGGNRETSGPVAHRLGVDEHHLEIFAIETETAHRQMPIDLVGGLGTAVLRLLAHQIQTRRLACRHSDAVVGLCVVGEGEEEVTGNPTEDVRHEHRTMIAATAIPEVDLRRLDGVGIGMTVTVEIDIHRMPTSSGAIPEMTANETTAI